MHPFPWGERKGDNMGLNATGFSALSLILIMHNGCVDAEKAAEYGAAGNKKGLFQEMALGADRFLEQHRDHSCVPGLEADHLCILMALFQIDCEFKAGKRDQNGDLIQ
jgi:hypothetical protein